MRADPRRLGARRGPVDKVPNAEFLCRQDSADASKQLTIFFRWLPILASIAFASSADAGALDQDAIENIPIGEAIRLSDLSSFHAAVICVLPPYQDRLSAKDTFAVRGNKYLAENNFVSDEGHFAFVLIGTETIDISTFKRSRQLDILAKREMTSIRERLPEGFVPQDCVSGDLAALARIVFHDRTYAVLGETR